MSHFPKSPIYYGNLKRSVFLLALLTSVNALASTPVTAANETMLVDNNGCHVTVYQTPLSAQKNGEIKEICLIEGTTSGSVDPYEAIKWKNSTKQNSTNKTFTYKKSSNSRPVDTRRVFKDDYERVLTIVGSAKNTQMVWLRN